MIGHLKLVDNCPFMILIPIIRHGVLHIINIESFVNMHHTLEFS